MKKFLIPLAFFLGLLVFLAIGLKRDPHEIPSPLINKPAPHFSLSTLESDHKFSPADMLGKVWMFNVWATWCVSCREEHPLLNNLAQQNILPIIGLNYKDKDEPAIEWLNKMGNPYQLSVVDAGGQVGINYGVYGVPESFLIDQKGTIVHKFIGPLTLSSIQNELIPMINKLKAGQ